jgi:hypothetical protein
VLTLALIGAQEIPDPITDVYLAYLPVVTSKYPNLMPPPLQAGEEGWLRKWQESQAPDRCLEAAGTPYYLESEPGAPGWLAAIVETDAVTELELEVHIDDKVAIRGRMEYFDRECDFPRLHADHMEVIIISPDGSVRSKVAP